MPSRCFFVICRPVQEESFCTTDFAQNVSAEGDYTVPAVFAQLDVLLEHDALRVDQQFAAAKQDGVPDLT